MSTHDTLAAAVPQRNYVAEYKARKAESFDAYLARTFDADTLALARHIQAIMNEPNPFLKAS